MNTFDNFPAVSVDLLRKPVKPVSTLSSETKYGFAIKGILELSHPLPNNENLA
jgi:hypothetical protein